MKKDSKKIRKIDAIEKKAQNATQWIGSIQSLIVHTIVFASAFIIPFFGVPFDHVLLVLTTGLSLEAIYLAIFIQMSVNKNSEDIEEIQEDVEDIQEDIEEIGDEIEEIGDDVEEIQKDVDEIQEDVDEIQKDVDEIQEDVEEIEEDSTEDQKIELKESEALKSIQDTLIKLQKEIADIKHIKS